MTQQYIPRQLGIKVFPEANRLDFVYEDPSRPDRRENPELNASIYFDEPEDKEHKLDGKKLTLLGAVDGPDGEIDPRKLKIKHGRQTIVLGLNDAGQKPYFYRSLESENDRLRPKNALEIFKAMGLTD